MYKYRVRSKGLKYKIVAKNKGWFKKDIQNNTKSAFKKGDAPWNKGTKGVVKANKTSFKSKDMIGDKNNRWKDDDVGYYGLHTWVQRKKGKAKICEKCGSKENVQWANKSHEYKRDIDDWLELCFKCHRKYDRENGWGKATKKYPELNHNKQVV